MFHLCTVFIQLLSSLNLVGYKIMHLHANMPSVTSTHTHLQSLH